ncbi:MAG TPA: hypothetical protein VIM69_03695 [Opitutaceae bacterium]
MKTVVTSGCPRTVSEKLCAVYEAETGKVIHFHATTHFEGSPETPESEIYRRALELAQSSRRSPVPTNIKTCLVNPNSEKPGCTHRIDLATLELIAIPRFESGENP